MWVVQGDASPSVADGILPHVADDGWVWEIGDLTNDGR